MSGQFGNGASGASPPSLKVRPQHEYTLEEVRPLLEGVKKSGQGWVARCPAHDDREASLSLRVGDDRPLVMHCHAGCTYDQILAALREPSTRKDTTDMPSTSNAPEDLGEPAAIYSYTDTRGTEVYQSLRYVRPDGKKTFRQRRPNKKGGWTWNLPKESPHYLYRLAEFLKKARVTAFLVEGEKDADTLWAHKLPALTNVAGAGKWREEYAQQLLDAGVKQAVVFPDNDAAGAAHTETVAASLHAAGLAVKVVNLPVAEKGDVSDYLAEHTKEDLFALVKAAPLYTPPAPTQQQQVVGGIYYTNLGDVEPEEVEWLWPGRIPLGMLTIIAGTPGLGKSFVSLDVTSRVTTGAIWPDVGEDAPQGTVVLLSAEDSVKHTIVPRLIALKADRYKVNRIDAVETVDKQGRTTFSLATDIPRLEKMVLTTGAKLVVVDPVNSYLGGKQDGFKDTEVRSVLDPLKEMAERLEIAVILIMHLKKGTEEEILYRIGGSIAFGAVVRSVFFCARDPETEGRVYFTCAKLSIAAKPPTLAFRIHPDLTLEWGKDPIKLTAQEILSTTQGRPGPQQSARTEVKRWLVEFLKDGPQPAAEGERVAVEMEFKEATLRRALKDLGIVSATTRNPESGQITGHVWTLPQRPEEKPF